MDGSIQAEGPLSSGAGVQFLYKAGTFLFFFFGFESGHIFCTTAPPLHQVCIPTGSTYHMKFFIIFLHDDGLSTATFIVTDIYRFYAPQGDALQQGTEVSHCIAACF